MRITPAFDLFEDQPGLSPELQHTLDERGMQAWLDDWHAGNAGVAYDPELDHNQNGEILAERIHILVIPFSRRNCGIVWQILAEEGALIRIPVPEEKPAPTPMTFAHIWPADSRPKSATSLVLDPKTAELQAKASEERKARVVERQSEPIPSVTVEEARKMAPLPAVGREAHDQTLKEIRKDRKLDITELRDAANRERIAIAKSRGTYNRGY